MQQKQAQGLTRFPEGSIRELWSISYPLMISTLATLFMLFTDRIFLANYSIHTLNASVTAGTLAWAFMGGFSMVTAMSEVFVAQYNGARQFERLGTPVWQMIWVAVLSLGFFVPFALFAAPAIFSSGPYVQDEVTYFRWLVVFSPVYALLTAFAGFFIGQGKARVMIWLAIVANVFNILLDWLLIFGVKGWIPELGIQGAAIATCFGYCFESAVLGYLFLKKENRVRFGTGNWRLNWNEMKKCLRVGSPQGVFVFLEIVGWSLFYWMMNKMGPVHITISSLCQSFCLFLSFFCEGLNRGSAAVAGNFIGAKRHDMVHKVLRAGVALIILFSVITSFVLVVEPESIIHILFANSKDLEQLIAFGDALKTCLILSFCYLFFDGIRWLLGGLLTAAGDTLFLLIFGSLSVWGFLLLPLYLIVMQNNLSVEYAWGLTVAYSFVFCLLYYIRFKRGAWQKIDLISQHAHTEEGSFEPPRPPTPEA